MRKSKNSKNRQNSLPAVHMLAASLLAVRLVPPGQTNNGPPGQNGTSPGLQLPPPGQNGQTSPSQGIPIPAGQQQRAMKSAYLDDEADEEFRKHHYVPVAYISTIGLGRDMPMLGQHDIGPAVMFYEQNRAPKVWSQAGILILSDGTILLKTDHPMIVRAGDQKITLRKGILAWISVDAQGTVVRCVSDEHACSVLVSDEQHGKITLSAGQQLAMGNADGFDRVGQRRAQRHSLPEGRFAITSEFSVMSLLAADRIFNLVRTSTSKNDQAIVTKVLKIAACLQLATASHGSYKRFAP